MRGRIHSRKVTGILSGLSALLILLLVLGSAGAPHNPETGLGPLKPSVKTPTEKPTNAQGTVHARDESGSGGFNIIDNLLSGSNFTVASSGDSVARRSGITARERIPLSEESATVVINDKVYPLRAYQPLLVPNDPSASQWWTSATNLPQAWDITTGTSDVTMAVIDTGFALNHEEFTGRWYNNSGESGVASNEAPSRLNCTDQNLPLQKECNLVDDDLDGIVDNETGATTYENPSKLNCSDLGRPLAEDCNNIDDDGNGYVDDVRGWDFMNQDNSVQAGELNALGDSTTHGTMVAGVAAASGNNGRGIAGVNWSVKILPLQALDDDGYGDTVSVGQAIYYAVSQHVEVINISLGTAYNDPYVQQAVQTASAAGITVVVASGNDGCNCISYPARYPETLAVGALDMNGTPASFSSYGAELDVLAPGVNIRTPTWHAGAPSSAYAVGVNGTSFAAPYVAGIVASLKSLRPSANPLQMIGAIGETNSRPLTMQSRPLDSKYGFGIINAYDVTRRMSLPRTGAQVYRLSPVHRGEYLVAGNFYESGSNYGVYDCPDSQGTTPVYQMTRAGNIFYTISKIEMQKAITSGYAASRFTYACIHQDHDVYEIARLIDIFKEFKNDYITR